MERARAAMRSPTTEIHLRRIDRMPAHGPAKTSRRRTWILLATAYAAALAVACLLFLAQRIYSRHATFSQRQFFWVGDIHEDAPMGIRMGAHRTGFAVLNHGLRDPARRIAVHTDQLGCRVPVGVDSTVLMPGGIAAIGCSCTFGHGVAAESSYVALAGDMLSAPAFNLGVCGYSGVTSLLRLRELIATIRPRWVVYGFGNFHLQRSISPRADNDVFQAYARCAGDSCFIVPPLFDNRPLFESSAGVEELYYVPRLAGRSTSFDLARLKLLLPLATNDLRRALSPSMIQARLVSHALPDSALSRLLLREMLKTCREYEASFALLYFPSYFGERPAPGMSAAVEELQGGPDFIFVDCSPGLFAGIDDQEDYSRRWQVPRDGHPNRFMHLEMARTLAQAIARADSVATHPNTASSPGQHQSPGMQSSLR